MAVVLWQPRSNVHQLADTVRESTNQENERSRVVEEAAAAAPVAQDVEITDDDTNNNEPITDFNVASVQRPHQDDHSMEEDL